MRFALIVPVIIITVGMLNGCADTTQSPRKDTQSRPPGAPAADPAYDEGQRSQALEGNTR
jgi:hypothetical protein